MVPCPCWIDGMGISGPSSRPGVVMSRRAGIYVSGRRLCPEILSVRGCVCGAPGHGPHGLGMPKQYHPTPATATLC